MYANRVLQRLAHVFWQLGCVSWVNLTAQGKPADRYWSLLARRGFEHAEDAPVTLAGASVMLGIDDADDADEWIVEKLCEVYPTAIIDFPPPVLSPPDFLLLYCNVCAQPIRLSHGVAQAFEWK